MLRTSYVQPLTNVQVTVAHASVASSKPKVEIDSHADTCVVGDNCLVLHDQNRQVNVYSYDPKDGHRSAKTVDAAVGYQDPQSGQKFILMINQAICIDGLVNHLLCPMQCPLNGVHFRSEAYEFLSQLFVRDDVPPTCICDNATELVQGKFQSSKRLHVT